MVKWVCFLVQSLAEPLVMGYTETDVQGSALLINVITIDVDRPRRYPCLSDFVVRLWWDLLSVSVLHRPERTEHRHGDSHHGMDYQLHRRRGSIF
jgi:hypothetical protein